ncbi:hypothetical protein [Arundinibacter roseus]|uniref:Uncharacterized protein n=1 Tax=Arundinibacter roseus TaxID=2070510 RepID=A0A4R4JZH9_9BACT|nr:hypothetical protein [Arundinibacter roseus]TDB59566.1 hypothetical protein EZE20_22470 [Arundinibacter roseus]
MKPALRLLSWLLMAAMLITCRPDKVEPDPFTDGKPRIVSIRFPGIPEKNVTIDQKNLLITIRVPSVLLKDMVPVLELTENAETMGKAFYTIFAGPESCMGCKEIWVRRLEDQSNTSVVKYKVKLIPNGPLEMGVMKESLHYILHDDPTGVLLVPMINLYGNTVPIAAELVERTTKEKILIDESSRIYPGAETTTNHLILYMYALKNQLPGTYDIDLKMADGRTLRAPQPVVIEKGPAYIASYQQFFYYGLDAPIGTTVLVEGYNLFSGDITLEITDRTGKTFSLGNLVFERYGLRMGIPIPADLPTGQYVMRMYQFGVARPACFRLNVRKGKSSDARIGTIGDDPMPCSVREPVRIGRNIPTNFTYSLTFELPNRPRLKLVPADGNPAVHYGSVAPYVLQPEPIGPAKLIIGSEVPPGLYIATVQYLDINGLVVAESDPYGRLLEVY